MTRKEKNRLKEKRKYNTWVRHGKSWKENAYTQYFENSTHLVGRPNKRHVDDDWEFEKEFHLETDFKYFVHQANPRLDWFELDWSYLSDNPDLVWGYFDGPSSPCSILGTECMGT